MDQKYTKKYLNNKLLLAHFKSIIYFKKTKARQQEEEKLLHMSISEVSVQKGTVELIGASWWHGLKENLLAALTLSVKNKLAEGEEFCLGFEMADFL